MLKRLISLFMLLSFFIISVYSCDGGGKNESSEVPADSFTRSLPVRLTPAGLSADGTSPEALYSLFDGDSNTVFSASAPVRVQVNLAEAAVIESLKVFGKPCCTISIAVPGNDHAIVSAASGQFSSPNSWNSVSCSSNTKSACYTILIEPAAGKTAGVPEIELWTKKPYVVEKGMLSLRTKEGGDRDELLSSVTGNSEYITESDVTPYELVVKSDQEKESPVSIDLNIHSDPALFERAYLVYEGYNIFKPYTIERKINAGPWSGGLARPDSGDPDKSWQSHIEEINPAWLKSGTNTVSFYTDHDFSIRNCRVILAGRSGWDYICSGSHPAVIDNNTGSGLPFGDSETLQLDFERSVVPAALLVHVAGSAPVSARLEYFTGGVWLDPASGPVMDGQTLETGWNRIVPENGYCAEKIRLCFSGEGEETITVNEVRVMASPAGDRADYPRFVFNYPDNGRFYGRTACVQGFTTAPVTAVTTGSKTTVTGSDGSFCFATTKEENGFADQNDDSAWNITARFSINRDPWSMTRNITLDKNCNESSSASVNDDGDDTSDNDTATGTGSTGQADTYRGKIYPDRSRIVNFRDIVVSIPEGSVDSETDLVIVPLTEEELPELDEGMVNVTSPAAGYRFLPHGTFKKNLKIHFKYSRSRMKTGQEDRDVFMYYYDEENKKWERLDRVEVDTEKSVVISETDHFTDIINATLVVPDSPNPLNYNPNSIKDIKAANPASKVNLVEVPQAGNTGNAALQYPLELPKGRNGMQPQVAVSYNSGGGNGWLGQGWDIQVPAVMIDTRFGVPRYTGNERYLLDGAQLVKKSGTDDQYVQRVEGAFRRIVRKGDGPASYYWEVTDKSGTLFIYGQGSESRLSSYHDNNIFQWYLEKAVDTNGNTMTYIYDRDEEPDPPDGEPWTGRYLKEIRYTGNGSDDGAYTVRFTRETTERPDVTVNGRAGFKIVNRYRLAEVEVLFQSQLVRKYTFTYIEGRFHKSLLAKISQYGDDGTTLFNEHEFEYYDAFSDDSDEVLTGFGEVTGWDNATRVSGDLYLSYDNMDKTTGLGGSTGTSKSGHFFGGFAPFNDSKIFSFGKKVGFDRGDDTTLLAVMDINGDGLADQVYTRGGSVMYRPNLGGPGGEARFGNETVISGFPANNLGSNKSRSRVSGRKVYVGAGGISRDKSSGQSTSNSYFTDANGDGLVDFVRNNTVYFGDISGGELNFGPESPVPFGGGSVDTDGLDLGDIPTPEEIAQEYHRDDPLRKWRAPFEGNVSISGTVSLPDGSQSVDGVRVSICTSDGSDANESVLWSVVLKPGGSTSATHNLSNVVVETGQSIYFRVNSIEEGSDDAVLWDPEITYQYVDDSLTDENGLPVYRFKASDDFSLAGSGVEWKCGLGGTIVIAGTLNKGVVTSDNIVLTVTRNDTAVHTQVFAYDRVDDAIEVTLELDVSAGDNIVCELAADTPVDWSGISFAPTATYVAADDDTNLYDDDDNPLMVFDLPVTIPVYHYQSARPAEAYRVPDGPYGTSVRSARIVFGVDVLKNSQDIDWLPDGYETRVVCTVKQKNRLVAKSSGIIVKGSDGFVFDDVVGLAVDEEYYFTCSVEKHDLFEYSVMPVQPVIYFSDEQYTGLPEPVSHSASGMFYMRNNGSLPYAGGHRNWYYGRWNGEIDNLNEEEMVLPEQPSNSDPGSIADEEQDAFELQLKTFCAATPDRAGNIWRGRDEDSWIGPGSMSSTRVVMKELPDPDESPAGGSGRAVTKITKTSNRATGASVGPVSGSQSESGSNTYIDFFDFNGDRYPDIISKNAAQFTLPDGSLESARSAFNFNYGYIRYNESDNESLTVDPFSALSLVETACDPDGKVSRLLSNMPPLGFSGTAARGKTETVHDFADVNGDGLPDYIAQATVDGEQCVVVRLNLGYRFGKQRVWEGSSNFRINRNANVSGNLGFSWERTGIGAGTSLSRSQSAIAVDYIDINGDGLPDRVEKKLKTSSSDGVEVDDDRLLVYINTGQGLASPVEWGGSLNNRPVSMNEIIVQNLSGYFQYKQRIILPFIGFIGTIIINPGGNTGKQVGKVTVSMQDINGDGLVDHVYSDTGGTVRAVLNRTGKTNLLKRVKRPLGGSFEIGYERAGNTTDMPQSRWVMNKVTTRDGTEDEGLLSLFSTDESVHTYVTEYAYKDGTYDRVEREFYGFNRVIQSNADGSIVERTFLNDDFYTRSIEQKSVVRDGAGLLYSVTENTVKTRALVSGSAYFPYVETKVSRFYEGLTNDEGSPGKTTSQFFEYDDYGNVSTFIDYGDGGSGDDAQALIAYEYRDSDYLVALPVSITVTGGDGRLYRRRQGSYDAAGNLVSLAESIDGSTVATTSIDYYANGNLQRVTGPANHRGDRYAVSYTYDSVTGTYIEGISDSFGYSSTAQYDYKFGVPLSTVDLNGNEMTYQYDTFGRTTAMRGPYDIASSIPTIAMSYGDVMSALPVAVTKNKPHWESSETIDTVTVIDGLQRVIQVKKTAEVYKESGMTMSGSVVFDNMGRVVKQGQPLFEIGTNHGYTDSGEPRNPTITHYDILGRKVKIENPDESSNTGYFSVSNTFSFEEGMFVTITIDQKGMVKRALRDVRGTIVAMKEVQEGSDVVTRYTYNAMKEIEAVQDAGGNVTTVSYDMLGRRTTVNNPDSGLVAYAYDAAGNMTHKTTPNLRCKGKSIGYVYDFNRLVSIDYPYSPDVTYTYGAPGSSYKRAGRVKEVKNGTVREKRYYGKLGETVKNIKTIYNYKPYWYGRTFVTCYSFDNMGRMMSLVYPDGETLTYRYDSGGLLEHAEGSKCGKTCVYLDDMAYDEFGQRIYLKTGNGVTTEYSYFAKSRRLSSLYTANSDGSVFQNINYTYDAVGNITAMTNNDFEIKPRNTRTVTQYYQYDDLHRLVSAAGDYICKEKEVNKYTNSFSYDTIGNLTRKEQVNRLMHWPGHYSTIHNTTYTLDYRYKSPKPHAVTCDGTRSYSYDPNGNMTGVASHKGFFRRTMLWDEENRMISTWDNGSLTEYRYDDSGQRAIKRGKYGELTYVNSNFTIRNGETASKHIFAGNTRLATKMVRNTFSHGYPYGSGHNPWNYFNYPYFWNYPYYGGHSYTNYHWGHWYYGGYSNWNNYYHYKHKNEKSYWYTGNHGSKYNNSHSYYGTYGYTCHHNVCGKEVYYYHGDHLGSGNVISDSKGSMYEHIEYFPYGETWIDELYSQVDLPYKFTGKELDAETGLYYYGARYYEPVLSKWISADPAFGDYLSGKRSMGGVFNPININLYTYTHNNPIKYIDPDGLATWKKVSGFKDWWYHADYSAGGGDPKHLQFGKGKDPQSSKFTLFNRRVYRDSKGNITQRPHGKSGGKRGNKDIPQSVAKAAFDQQNRMSVPTVEISDTWFGLGDEEYFYERNVSTEDIVKLGIQFDKEKIAKFSTIDIKVYRNLKTGAMRAHQSGGAHYKPGVQSGYNGVFAPYSLNGNVSPLFLPSSGLQPMVPVRTTVPILRPILVP